MALKHTPIMLPAVVAMLAASRGGFQKIAAETGVNYNTLQAISQGKSRNPGVNTVELLHQYLSDKAA